MDESERWVSGALLPPLLPSDRDSGEDLPLLLPPPPPKVVLARADEEVEALMRLPAPDLGGGEEEPVGTGSSEFSVPARPRGLTTRLSRSSVCGSW